MIKHICSGLIVTYPIYRDMQERKINLFPAVCLTVIGLAAEIINGNFTGGVLVQGILPGLACFGIGIIFRECIGRGDSILIAMLGMLEGFSFCVRTLGISMLGLLAVSLAGLAAGRLKLSSEIPFVPFLAAGYVGAWLL